MDLTDMSQMSGTLPKNGGVQAAASLLVFMEGARTMSSMCGDSRFRSPYGGELMAASYTAAIATLACTITKSALPAFAAIVAIVLFGGLYHWTENTLSDYGQLD